MKTETNKLSDPKAVTIWLKVEGVDALAPMGSAR